LFNQVAHKITDARMARDGVVKALELINPNQNEDANILPYDGNNAKVVDPSKFDTTGWTSHITLHATALQVDIPGYDGLSVAIYFNDSEREGLTTIGLIHTGAAHVCDFWFNYNRLDRSNHTNADIAREFCDKGKGGCP
jgi:hypothetical protein